MDPPPIAYQSDADENGRNTVKLSFQRFLESVIFGKFSCRIGFGVFYVLSKTRKNAFKILLEVIILQDMKLMKKINTYVPNIIGDKYLKI